MVISPAEVLHFLLKVLVLFWRTHPAWRLLQKGGHLNKKLKVVVLVVVVSHHLQNMAIFGAWFHLPSRRQHLNNDDFPKDKREDVRNVLCCIVYDSVTQ